ncbi:Centrosomal protein 190kD [Carabus blaptoides fortunei]
MGESKQVKVDNWGIFFLQRLQHFFNKTYFCDLTLQFEDNAQLKVHRLVMNACTEYFQMLEQTCEMINDCLIMPPDLQADVVVPIVNFMYTGILEFHESIFDRLYSTARLMNMTVLTKLLDAQKVPISPIPKPMNKRTPVTPITWNLQGKRIAPKTMDPDLPEPLPGRKLPIWKRKSVPGTITYRSTDKSSMPEPLATKYFKSSVDDTPKPTRFEWPEEDDNSFDTSSFDEISYTSKPLLLPSREKSPKPSTSNFEELKRSSSSLKRPASPVYNDNKKVNIQDVKEYLKEQKLRSDYIDYDDSEAADNDLQTYDDDDSTEESADKDAVFDQNAEDTPNKSILKNDASTPHNKRVRFSLEGKENASVKATSKPAATPAVKAGTSVDMSNHTKIITEVLKKYPHLVKKNKNIRLKILAKGSGANSTGVKPSGAPVKVVKPTSKVSYMVMKPEQSSTQSGDKKDGQWLCHKCSSTNPPQFDAYHLYRKHLTEVHNEKVDSQMCNICGHVSRKQNMLMYHKYVKHNITPPPLYQFPKCKECPYIALSPTLLTKHQYNHTHLNLVCAECGTAFTTKSQLIAHIQMTGHSEKSNSQTYDCGYCSKKFISDETLFQHIKKNHKSEARRDNIISCEEIDEMENSELTTAQASAPPPLREAPKEKIKILSDIKVNTPISTSGLLPVRTVTTIPSEKIQKIEETRIEDSQPLEPSSEAESLSNVASGIAASLGLVNTIVVLDENQFILQSQDGEQENISGTGRTEFILPEVTNIENIPNLHVSQHQVITADNNTIISQATLNKNNITSTDELVMVLTDHDYSDASNNAVITSENSNIVVLYSHPVQSQDGQFISQQGNLMINSDMSLMEVSNNYTVANTVTTDTKPCEESIEMIQQEINNHLEGDLAQGIHTEQVEKTLEDQIITYVDVKPQVLQEQQTEMLPKEIPEKIEIDPVEVHLDAEELEFVKQKQIEEDKILLPTTTDTTVLSESTSVLTSTAVLADKTNVLMENTAILPDNTEMLTEVLTNTNGTELITTTTGILTGTTETLVDTAGVLTQNAEITELPESTADTTQILTDSTNILTENSENLTDNTTTIIVDNTSILADSTNGLQVQEIAENTNLTIQNNEHQYEEPMEIEESIELIEKEIAKNSPERSDVTPVAEPASTTIVVENPNLDTSVSAGIVESVNESEKTTIEVIQPKSDTTVQIESNGTPAADVITNQDSVNEKVVVENESLQFDEPMEVDSAKLTQTEHNENLVQETTIEESVATVDEVIKENINTDEIVPDSEEEKSIAGDEIQLNRDEVDAQQTADTNTHLQEEVDNATQNADSIQKTNENAITENISTEIVDETVVENMPLNVVEHVEESAEIVESKIQSEVTLPEETPQKLLANDEIFEKKNVVEDNSVAIEPVDAQENCSNSPVTTQDVVASPTISENNKSNNTELLNPLTTNSKISNLLDDWDDGDTDSQQSDAAKPPTTVATTISTDNSNSINTLINDWEDEEDT